MKKIIDEIYEDDFCKSLSEKLTEEEKKIVSKEVESMESILSKGAEFWQQKK